MRPILSTLLQRDEQSGYFCWGVSQKRTPREEEVALPFIRLRIMDDTGTEAAIHYSQIQHWAGGRVTPAVLQTTAHLPVLLPADTTPVTTSLMGLLQK